MGFFPENPYYERRLKALEADSHPPVQFEECGDCHCLVAPGQMLSHEVVMHPYEED